MCKEDNGLKKESKAENILKRRCERGHGKYRIGRRVTVEFVVREGKQR